MLIDTQYKGDKLIISYVDKKGSIKLKYYNWDTPMKYVVCEDNDPLRHKKFKSWDGKSVKQIPVAYPDRYAIYEFLDSLPQEEQDEIFEFNTPNMYFIDIETRIVDGFPEAEDILDKEGNIVKEGAATEVLAISVVYDDKIFLLGLEDMSDVMKERITQRTNEYFKPLGDNIEYKFKYIKYDSEFDMLYFFFNNMVPKMPLMTGWNFLNYDWLFLVNRARKLVKYDNGKEYRINPSISSPTRKLNKKWGAKYEEPSHRMIFDYMQLYEIADTSIKVKESSSLDFVSGKLIGVNKIKYVNSIFKLNNSLSIKGYQFKKDDILRPDLNVDEITYYMYHDLSRIDLTKDEFEKIRNNFREINVSDLQSLYDNDFEIYMYYNCVDSVLVQKIHQTRDYISIIFAISSLARIKITDVVSQMNGALASLAITEGVLRNRFRDLENIVLFKDDTREKDSSTIAGGWVKEPLTGMNKWVVCYDFASLYPTTQRQFFIAPENFIGLQSKNDKTKCSNGKDITSDMVVCVNGAVFLKRRSPTIKMLEDVYADRKVNKKKMFVAMDELDETEKEIKRLEKMLLEME